MQKIAFFILIAATLFTVSCKRDPLPKDAIKKSKFIDVMVDVHLAESLIDSKTSHKMDSLDSRSLYLTVLKKHKVTEEQMVTTTLYYSRNPKEYDKVYVEILAKLNAMMEEKPTANAPTTQKLE